MSMNTTPKLKGLNTGKFDEDWVGIDGAGTVAEVGIPTQRHNRTISNITATWPSNDGFSVTWTQLENVRRYRLLVTGGTAGDYVKVVEDAATEAQAEAWLTDGIATTNITDNTQADPAVFTAASHGIGIGETTRVYIANIDGGTYDGGAGLADGFYIATGLTANTFDLQQLDLSDYVACTVKDPDFAAAAQATVTRMMDSTDVEYYIVHTSDTEANNYIAGWSEWIELSKQSEDDSLSRLDFLGSSTGPYTIFVEAE